MQPPPPPNWREIASLLARFLPWGLKREGHSILSFETVARKKTCHWFCNFTFATPRVPCNSLTRLEASAGGRLERWGSFTTKSSQVDISFSEKIKITYRFFSHFLTTRWPQDQITFSEMQVLMEDSRGATRSPPGLRIFDLLFPNTLFLVQLI